MQGSSGMLRRSGDVLVLSALLLLVLGIVMLASTSVFGSTARAEEPYFDVKRQIVWTLGGAVFAVCLALVDYRKLRPLAIWIYALAVLLLAGCFVPGVGLEINGERRWIEIAGKSLQPSEFAKLALVLWLAGWYAGEKAKVDSWARRTGWPVLLAGVVLLLIALEVDIGTTVVLGVVVAGVLYVAGVSRVLLGGGLVAGVAGILALAWLVPGKRERILALVHLDRYEQTVGMQQKMAQLALGSGGVEGVGLGAGRMKMQYLPFAHTDFIFPMIGEELGLAATTGVVLCFLTFGVMGLVIAMRAPDEFGRLLGTGLVLCIVVQAVVNLAVTTGVFPNTGLPLPFVSYGGSNLVCSMLCVGVLMSIHREGGRARRRDELPRKEEPVTPRI